MIALMDTVLAVTDNNLTGSPILKNFACGADYRLHRAKNLLYLN